MKLTFNNPTLPIGEIRITRAFSEHMPRMEKLKACRDFYRENKRFDRQIIVDHEKYLHDGYCAYLVAQLMGVEKVKVLMVDEKPVRRNYAKKPTGGIKTADSKLVKLFCVKSFSNALTKGKLYEFDGHRVNYDSVTCFYAKDFEDWKKGDPSFSQCLFRLVKRPAKVGEWIIATDSDGHEAKINVPYMVFRCGESSHEWAYVGNPGSSMCIRDDQYLVLDGYHGECE